MSVFSKVKIKNINYLIFIFSILFGGYLFWNNLNVIVVDFYRIYNTSKFDFSLNFEIFTSFYKNKNHSMREYWKNKVENIF